MAAAPWPSPAAAMAARPAATNGDAIFYAATLAAAKATACRAAYCRKRSAVRAEQCQHASTGSICRSLAAKAHNAAAAMATATRRATAPTAAAAGSCTSHAGALLRLRRAAPAAAGQLQQLQTTRSTSSSNWPAFSLRLQQCSGQQLFGAADRGCRPTCPAASTRCKRTATGV